MLSIEQARKIEPELNNLEDEEALEVIKDMHGLIELAFDKWIKEHDSKNPTWVLRKNSEG